MKITCLIATLLLLGAAGTARSQTPADSAAIRATALDYIEGWYAGDADRMARAVHPELVKRIIGTDPESGSRWIDEMGASRLIEGTRAGYGTQTPEAERRTDVTILDIFRNVASVRVDAGGWIDYMHLARWDGRWTIVNVLWEMREEAGG